MKRALIAIPILLSACRGQTGDQPPIHFEDKLANQPKFTPQGVSPKKADGKTPLFADNRIARPIEEGTVSTSLKEEAIPFDDEAYHEGKVGNAYLAKSPVSLTEKVLARGEERFNIYCSVCHDRAGSGQGLVIKRGFKPGPVSLASEGTIARPDGEIFSIISHGKGNMPSYGAQIPVADRWAIVAWLRVLQRSQHAAFSDVPPEMTQKIEKEPSK